MPYLDPEARRAASRRSKARRRSTPEGRAAIKAEAERYAARAASVVRLCSDCAAPIDAPAVHWRPRRFCDACASRRRARGRYGDRSLADRLWGRVDRSAGPDGCWPWLGCLNRTGYGQIADEEGALQLTHRVALSLSLGRPLTAFALHHCDNPPCCNPAHLYEGTQADNIRDMVARGRARGPHSRQGVIDAR